MKYLITLLLLLPLSALRSQTTIDSVLVKIAAEKNDDARVEIIADIFYETAESDPLQALENLQKIELQSLDHDDPIGASLALACMAYHYRSLGNNAKAMELALKGYRGAQKAGNLKALNLVYAIVGTCYKDIADYPKALKYFHLQVESCEKTKYYKSQTWGYENITEVYLALNETDSAFKYAQKDYELLNRIKYFKFIGYTLLNLGAVQGRMGNKALALNYYEMAIQEGQKLRSAKLVSWALISKAQYLYSIHETDSATATAKYAIAVVDNTPFENYSIKPAKLLLEYYKDKNTDSAFKYSEIYRTTNDSLFNVRVIQQTQLLTFEDELRQEELEAQLEKDKEQRHQNIQYALIALGIISFIMVFLLLSRSFITNAKVIEFFGVVALLIVFEFLNLLLHPFLERVTFHSPVLMLLALVCIAGLLVPLHHRVEKFALTRLVEKNKRIRLQKAKETIEKLAGEGAS